MKDAEKNIQNTTEEGGEEEPPLEVSDSEMDLDTGECSIYIFAIRRSVFPWHRTLVRLANGNNSIYHVSSV